MALIGNLDEGMGLVVLYDIVPDILLDRVDL